MSYAHQNVTAAVIAILTEEPAQSLAQIAVRIGVGRHRIEQCVLQSTGKSFRRIRAEMRLDRAVQLFTAHPPLSMKQVAATLGYGSQQAFSRFVRQETGMAPTELRRAANESAPMFDVRGESTPTANG